MSFAIWMQALDLVFDPQVLIVILGAAVFGLFIGCIPGLTATMATALLVPLTFFMPPRPRWRFFQGISRALCYGFPAHPPRPPMPTRPIR